MLRPPTFRNLGGDPEGWMYTVEGNLLAWPGPVALATTADNGPDLTARANESSDTFPGSSSPSFRIL